MAHTAINPIIILPTVLASTRPASPVKIESDVCAGSRWPVGSIPVAKLVTLVGPPSGPRGGDVGVGTAGAGAGLPAARTMRGDPVAPWLGDWVVNWTCGTVTSVERTETVDDEGIGWPAEIPAEKVQGTVTVLTMAMVVTGAGDGGLTGTVPNAPVAEGLAGGRTGTGTGARLTFLGTSVMIPGFSGTCGAQMPAR
jgi:hypothetical protein